MVLRLLSLLLLPGLASATLNFEDWDWNGKNKGGKMGPISVPPALHRPALGARVLGAGERRAGFHVDVQNSRDSGRELGNPYAENGFFWAGGISSRMGLTEGFEFLFGLDYPFFVPSLEARVQPIPVNIPFVPLVTLEVGANAMPDIYAGAVIGLPLGPVFEPWVSYRGGWVLDRGYSELGLGATLHAGSVVDVGGGLSWRRYDTFPFEQTGRVSLRFDLAEEPQKTPEMAEKRAENRENKRTAYREEDEDDEPRNGRSAQALLEAGRYKAARDVYELELLEHPDDPVRWKGYATALDELGLSRKAQNARDRAKKLESR